MKSKLRCWESIEISFWHPLSYSCEKRFKYSIKNWSEICFQMSNRYEKCILWILKLKRNQASQSRMCLWRRSQQSRFPTKKNKKSILTSHWAADGKSEEWPRPQSRSSRSREVRRSGRAWGGLPQSKYSSQQASASRWVFRWTTSACGR